MIQNYFPFLDFYTDNVMVTRRRRFVTFDGPICYEYSKGVVLCESFTAVFLHNRSGKLLQ